MSNLPPIEPNSADEVVTFESRDGWRLEGVFRLPAAAVRRPNGAAVLVHGSHHERDAYVYGRAVADVLADHGFASLRFDHRGRGGSRWPRAWRELTALERRGVAHDIAAASDWIRERANVDDGKVAIVSEQDSSSPAVAALEQCPYAAALVLLSPRLSRTSVERLRSRSMPVCALVSKEDRVALDAATHAYLAGTPRRSELHVFGGLGFGTTMFMARYFQHPDEEPLEEIIAVWLERELDPDT